MGGGLCKQDRDGMDSRSSIGGLSAGALTAGSGAGLTV